MPYLGDAAVMAMLRDQPTINDPVPQDSGYTFRVKLAMCLSLGSPHPDAANPWRL